MYLALSMKQVLPGVCYCVFSRFTYILFEGCLFIIFLVFCFGFCFFLGGGAFLCVCFLCFGFIFVIILFCFLFFCSFLTSRNVSVERNNQQNYIPFNVNIFHWLMRLYISHCNAVKGLTLIRKIQAKNLWHTLAIIHQITTCVL